LTRNHPIYQKYTEADDGGISPKKTTKKKWERVVKKRENIFHRKIRFDDYEMK
jgi:hypothetical protein